MTCQRVFLIRISGTNHSLHSQTRSAALGESEHSLLDVLPAVVLLIQPTLGDELVGIGEDTLLVVGDGGGHANGKTAGDNILDGLLVELAAVDQVFLSGDASSARRDTVRQTKTLLDDRTEVGKGLQGRPGWEVLRISDNPIEFLAELREEFGLSQEVISHDGQGPAGGLRTGADNGRGFVAQSLGLLFEHGEFRLQKGTEDCGALMSDAGIEFLLGLLDPVRDIDLQRLDEQGDIRG